MFADIYTISMLALAAYREARGEPDGGILAVMFVIMNRSKDARNRWSKDPVEVITQPLQFSSISYKGDAQLTLFPNAAQAFKFVKLAFQAYYGLVPDPTGGANHYHATYVNPSWADPLRMTTQIEHHKFYKL